MANSAHIYRSKSGNWNISFHHPICRDGSIGKKIHRSLRVSDETEAQTLRQQMFTLLELAETPSLLPTRSHALAGKKYARVVIDAFFDCMAPEPVDYITLREREMPLPPRTGKEGAAPHLLLVGATGAGKSRLVQHLLQTTRENFPMRGAGRTTVADTEIIVEDANFSAVVTFFSANEIREIIKENILESCAFAHSYGKNKDKIASKLLVDRDKRFRFSFILGEWSDSSESIVEDEEEIEDEEEELELDKSLERSTPAWERLDSCISEIVSMADHAFEKARRELQPESDDDQLVIEEYWLQYVDQDQLDTLAEEILEELERRLCTATGRASWPTHHCISEITNKSEFFRQLRPFYQNNRRLFGALVTPLVQGIRVRGRFLPPPWAASDLPRWVLIDGQGVGHEQGGSTKISRTVPPELAKKFSDVDLICLVDRAVPAMTGDAPILLENLIARGHQDRLAFLFTHFENAAAPDLDLAGRKEKVLEGLSSAIQGIGALPKAQRVLLERTAESKAYFLARLNRPEIDAKSTRSEMHRLCENIRRSAEKLEIPKFRPLYNEYQIATILSREITSFREDWSETELEAYHWKIMEALTNWIGHAYSNGYPKRNLYPGQDLSQRLVSAISIELELPTGWVPFKPETPDEESRILNAIRSKVGDRIDAYCNEILVRDVRTGFWLPAYENIFGRGTKVKRARAVARILEDRAQLPNEGLGRFTKDVWQIVESAIAEVCSSDESEESEIGVS